MWDIDYIHLYGSCYIDPLKFNTWALYSGVGACLGHFSNSSFPYWQTLGERGKAGFYEGRTAEAIAECVQQHGGCMTVEDLKSHQSTFDSPIKTTYRGIDVWEMPPNGQGITALLALNILEGFDFSGVCIHIMS